MVEIASGNLTTPRRIVHRTQNMCIWTHVIFGVEYQFFARLIELEPAYIRIYVFDMRTREITRRFQIFL